jgi:peptidoglycan/LPS O-acetylase OafA/YrhL
MSAPATPSSRVKGFDGMRGAAALLVVIHHTAITGTHLGDVSVYVFFELSGFLIFGMLADARRSIEHGHSTVMRELARFWTNRALRIFPVYYIALFVVVIAGGHFGGFQDLRESAFWYVTYTQNFLIAFITERWGSFTHTWSLAVEQQFYLLFGLIYLLVPTRRYGTTFLLLYLSCIVAIICLAALHLNPITIYALPFEGFSFIIAGGVVTFFRPQLLNALSLNQSAAERLTWSLVWTIVVLTLLPRSDAGGMWSRYLAVPIPGITILLTVLVAVFLWLVVSFPEMLIVRILEKRPFTFLGSISYALYVFHYPIAEEILRINGKCRCMHHAAFFLTLAIAIGLSLLSRTFIERPTAKLKRKRRTFVSRTPSNDRAGSGDAVLPPSND